MKKSLTYDDIAIPIYRVPEFSYVKISEIPDSAEYIKFMAGATFPMIVDETGESDPFDATYIWDYLNYLNYKAGNIYWFD